MKTQYQYIHFVEIAKKAKTSVWACRNNRVRGELGIIRWYGPWRQYCYFATNELAVYSSGCLKDICSFLADLSEERKQRLAMARPTLEG